MSFVSSLLHIGHCLETVNGLSKSVQRCINKHNKAENCNYIKAFEGFEDWLLEQTKKIEGYCRWPYDDPRAQVGFVFCDPMFNSSRKLRVDKLCTV